MYENMTLFSTKISDFAVQSAVINYGNIELFMVMLGCGYIAFQHNVIGTTVKWYINRIS